jgi:hypothetical protein
VKVKRNALHERDAEGEQRRGEVDTYLFIAKAIMRQIPPYRVNFGGDS